ncbi:MAG: Mov34/MPN/PAD-1 family protein [Lysobacterales bacterium]
MPSVILASNPLVRNGKILVESGVLSALEPFRQYESSSPEAGGILLGFRRGIHLHVVDLTTPQSCDTRSRMRFHRETEGHQQIALAHWSASGGYMDYLGEWHTHPERRPTPSMIDRKEWKAIIINRTTPMLFLVLGTEGLPWLEIGACAQLKPVHLRNQALVCA